MTDPDRGAAAALAPGAPGSPPQRPGAGVPRPAHAEPSTPDELHTGLRRLRALLAGRQPAESQTGLVPVEGGREMLLGTTVTPVQSRFVSRPSGLLIPAGAAPMPLDLASVYLSGAEVFGAAPSPALIVQELGRMPFSFVLSFAAATLAEHRDPDVPAGQTDREFAERWLGGPALVRAHNLLRDPTRRLIVPQAMYVLIKLAARYSPDAVLPDVAAPRPVLPYFGALEVIAAEHDELDHRDLVVDTEVGALASALVANQHFNQPLDEDHLMARFVRQWLELPAERATDKRVIDLERAFVEVTGVPLRDVVVVAVALWARSAIGQPYVPPDQVVVRGLGRDRLAAALGLFTADLTKLRGRLRQEAGEEDSSPAWSFSTLERYPVVRFDDGALLVLDRNLLVRRVFGGLALYDITAPLEDGDRAAGRRAKRVRGCVQHLAEVYALELLEAVASSSSAVRRVFGDADLQAALARPGRRIADAAVDYGDAWVVVEVTTSKLKRASVAASPEALSEDLDKLVDEVEQIDSTIAALRTEEPALTGVPAPARRFYPLLVVADGFPVNPVSTELLRQRVRRHGWLTGADVAPLEVVDTVELGLLQALAEQGGPSMRDVLAGKERAVFHRSSVRDYLLLECAVQPRRATRVSQLLDRAFRMAMDALRPADVA